MSEEKDADQFSKIIRACNTHSFSLHIHPVSFVHALKSYVLSRFVLLYLHTNYNIEKRGSFNFKSFFKSEIDKRFKDPSVWFLKQYVTL